ncbi:MAG: helix-turn-helix domain-containing protein [Polyangiaceae bacterium]
MSLKERAHKLSRLLRKRFPGIVVDVDPPSRAAGDWFVDAKLREQSLVIVFRPTLGFGLSSTPPDEFLDTEGAVIERIAALVTSRTRTEPQRVWLLQELRERRHVSQVALADKLRVRQPTISKIERRKDVNVSTLRRYVRALGGELQITARFPEGAVEIAPSSRRRAARAPR